MGTKKARTYKCRHCGETFETPLKRGRLPQWCPDHEPDSSNARRRARAEANSMAPSDSGRSAVHRTRLESEASVTAARQATECELLAVGLGMTADPRQAAAMVGIVGRSAPELRRLAKQAQKEHEDLIAGGRAAVGNVIFRSLAVVALKARERASALSPAQAISALKTLAQASELVSGKAGNVYANIVVEVPGLNDE